MPDNPPPTPLLQQLEETYQKLHATDGTIRKYQNEADRQSAVIRRAHALRKIALGARKKHEAWLREEAAMIVRKRNGVKTIPGFASTRENAIAFRKALDEKHRQAVLVAKQILNSTPPPSP